jgi:hypothetical protein
MSSNSPDRTNGAVEESTSPSEGVATTPANTLARQVSNISQPKVKSGIFGTSSNLSMCAREKKYIEMYLD